MPEWFQLAIIAFILLSIGYVVFRGGAANPIGTGTLQHNLTNVRANVNALTEKVKKLEATSASKESIAEIKSLLEDENERIEARLTEGSRKMERLGERLDGVELELGKIETAAKANQKVIEAMAESLRVTNKMVQDMQAQVEANSATIARVPGFIETVLTGLASNTARTDEVCKQVSRLYDFIVERGMSK